MGLTQANLTLAFNTAILGGDRFVAIKVRMEGFEQDEVIINERSNFQAKLAYYQQAYDDDLNHKYSKGISIVGFTSGNSFDDIQADLID